MSSSKSKVRPFDYVEGRMYKCRQCHNYIASESQRFNAEVNLDYNHGQADLFKSVSGMNVTYGPMRDRTIDGWEYRGRDVLCAGCRSIIGWKYHLLVGPEGDYDREGKVQLESTEVKGPDDA
ncbi:Protein yippee-like [Linum grandiflorum]